MDPVFKFLFCTVFIFSVLVHCVPKNNNCPGRFYFAASFYSVKESVHPSENHLGKKMMTTAKLFSLVIVSLLIGEIENLMVADLESPMVHPMVQPLVHSLGQEMVQPIDQLMVQPMFQYPHLAVIPSHGNNNRYVCNY